MANYRSAIKEIRKIDRKTIVNRRRRSRVRTSIKDVETALAAGSYEEAQKAFRQAQPLIQAGVTKGVMHRRTASRKISRLAHRIKALS